MHAYRNRKSGGKDWNRSIIAITPVRRSVISKRARFAVVLLSRFLMGQGAPPTVRAVDVTPVSRCIGRWIHNSYRLQYERPRNVSAPLCHRHVSQRSIISNTTDYFGSISFQGISIIPRNYSIIIEWSFRENNDLKKSIRIEMKFNISIRQELWRESLIFTNSSIFFLNFYFWNYIIYYIL